MLKKANSSSKVEQTGSPNFWLYAQCSWDRAAWWHRWMKIQLAMCDVTPASPVWCRCMKHSSKNKVRPFVLPYKMTLGSNQAKGKDLEYLVNIVKVQYLSLVNQGNKKEYNATYWESFVVWLEVLYLFLECYMIPSFIWAADISLDETNVPLSILPT